VKKLLEEEQRIPGVVTMEADRLIPVAEDPIKRFL